MVMKLNGKKLAVLGVVVLFGVLAVNSGEDSSMETAKVTPTVESEVSASYQGSTAELKKYVAKALNIDEDSISITESYSSSHSIEGYVRIPGEKKQLYVAIEWDGNGPIGIVIGSECYSIKDGELLLLGE